MNDTAASTLATDTESATSVSATDERVGKRAEDRGRGDFVIRSPPKPGHGGSGGGSNNGSKDINKKRHAGERLPMEKETISKQLVSVSSDPRSAEDLARARQRRRGRPGG